jgi:hypothetical protein
MNLNTLKKYTVCWLGKFPHKYRAYDLNYKNNIELKALLTKAGFFDFYIRNKGNVVYEHQIIAFFHCGGIHALKRGITCKSNNVEIHHINGRTIDNNPENLIYLPVVLHAFITKAQRALGKRLKTFRRFIEYNLIEQLEYIPFWNKQGRIVIGKLDFVMYILTLTMVKSIKDNNFNVNMNYLKAWANKVRQDIKEGWNSWRHNNILARAQWSNYKFHFVNFNTGLD